MSESRIPRENRICGIGLNIYFLLLLVNFNVFCLVLVLLLVQCILPTSIVPEKMASAKMTSTISMTGMLTCIWYVTLQVCRRFMHMWRLHWVVSTFCIDAHRNQLALIFLRLRIGTRNSVHAISSIPARANVRNSSSVYFYHIFTMPIGAFHNCRWSFLSKNLLNGHHFSLKR